MSRYAIAFLLLAVLAGALSFAALAGVAALLARVLLVLFLALAVAAAVFRRRG